MGSYHKIYMSPVQSSNLQSQLCALWKKQKFCDAVIKSDNISVMAHRLVLAASCPMLQSMENYSFGSLLEIRVESDMTKESVMAFLQYLYEGYLMLTEENYCLVEKLARSLHIDSIISFCKDFSQSVFSSSSNIHEPSGEADFKHVRITNLLKVLDSSQKRASESSDSDFSKRLKRSSLGKKNSDHCINESFTIKQESHLGPSQSQSVQLQGERIELRQGSSTSDQSESFLSNPNTVSMNINTKKAATSGEGMIFFSNTNLKERSSNSLNSVNSSNYEKGEKTPQVEPYPVLLKEVRQSSGPLSNNSSEVNVSCAGIVKDNGQPISRQNSSLQKTRQLRDNFNSQTHTSISTTAPNIDTSAEGDLSIVKVEPEDSIIQTKEGMFMSSTQVEETQISQSSWLHDNPSMSSEESSGQEEIPSSLISRTDEDVWRDQNQVTMERGSYVKSGSIVDERSLLKIGCGGTRSLINLFSEIDRQTEIAIQSVMAEDSKAKAESKPDIFTCTVCNKIFSTKYGHKMHMERFHPETLTKKSKKKYPKCKTCGKQMASGYALSIHEIKHTGAKTFQCKQCGTQFGYKHVLQKHMEVCDPSKNLKC